MSITTLTLNGVEIQTTATLAEIMATIQPKADTVVTLPMAAEPTNVATPSEPKARQARPAATKRTTARKPKATQGGGKALWAEITALVAEGQYDEARKAASVKPDTFGVQAEAAIKRHQARASKQGPKADAPKVEAAPKVKVAKPSPVVGDTAEGNDSVKRITPKAKAQAQDRKRNHKPDCGCVTCPNGIAKRQPKAAEPQPEPKAEPKARKAPKAKAAPKVDALQAETPIDATVERAENAEATRIIAKGNDEAKHMLDTLDVDGLRTAMRNYASLEKRNLRLGNKVLAMAYDEAADACHLALQMVAETLGTVK
jgi:hypothetical protein